MIGSAALVALALSAGLLLRSSPPAGATGMVFGCPAGSGSMGFPQGFRVLSQVDGAAAPTTVVDLDATQLQFMLGLDPGWRSLDVDGDGLFDLRWNVAYNQPLEPTNVDELWERLGGDLGAPHLDIRITLDRLSSDPTLPPLMVRGELPIPMTVPVDPADPDGPTTVEMHAASFGFDTRSDDATAPTTTVFDVILQAGSPSQPDTDHLGVRFATEYRVGSNPSAALVTPGTEPPVDTLVAIGPEADVGRDLDLTIAWDRAPAQLAFDKATTCTPANPHQELAWDYRADQAGSAVELPATDADIDLVTGRGQGYAGQDSFGLHGTVEHVPEEMTLELTETNARLRQNKHEENGTFPESSPAPNIVLDQLLITEPATGPGTSPTKLALSGKVVALPPETNLSIVNSATTGALQSVDLRFCPGTSWTDAACQADVRSPEKLELVVSDVLPGESTLLPALPSTTGPYVAYTERDVKGFTPAQSDKHFRVGWAARTGRAPERADTAVLLHRRRARERPAGGRPPRDEARRGQRPPEDLVPQRAGGGHRPGRGVRRSGLVVPGEDDGRVRQAGDSTVRAPLRLRHDQGGAVR